MNNITQAFIKESENFVSNLLDENLEESYYYHNFGHALQVKEFAEFLGKKNNL